ncbi:MAG: FkbM family methyltransferase [Acidimicrobiales bacterium]
MLDYLKPLVPMTLRRTLKIRRVRLFETLGSSRYSRPALDHLDEQLRPFLPSTPGVFLEIGANDGYTQSNTYFLESWLGWQGILIEPLPELYACCKRIRTRSRCFNVACVADVAADTVTIMDMNLMSVTLGQQDAEQERHRLRGGREIDVPATTLSAVIDQAGQPAIDFMSIDVEGAELSVLGGLDLERHSPHLLLVETAKPVAVEDLLEGHLTRVAQLSHHDYLFQRIDSRARGPAVHNQITHA